MEEQLLCRCSHIAANRVTDALEAEGIVFRVHDETLDQRPGAYGPVPGIAVYVYERDYERARVVADAVTGAGKEAEPEAESGETAAADTPFCPKCGSEDTVPVPRGRYVTHLSILSVLFIIVSGVYLTKSREWGISSQAADVLAVALVAADVVLMIVLKRRNVNWRCRSCGRRFLRP